MSPIDPRDLSAGPTQPSAAHAAAKVSARQDGGVAVVTGGGTGIGRATALALARRGLRVAVLGRRMAPLLSVAEAIEASGGAALALSCDVTSAAEVRRAAREIEARLGVPDLLVNNAGTVERAPVCDMTEAAWNRVIAANLTSAFLVTQAFLPQMIERDSGRVVSVGSISSTLGTPRLSAYCAAKWGLVGFVKSLAEELRGTGLASLAVLPGSVDTDMLKGSGFAPAMTPEEVAGTILYAGLDAPAAMNGAAIEVFG